MKNRKPKNGAVSPEQFVRIWQAADNLGEVAKKTGRGERSLSVKASDYRKRGVPLKKLYRGRAPLDIARLKRIAEGRR